MTNGDQSIKVKSRKTSREINLNSTREKPSKVNDYQWKDDGTQSSSQLEENLTQEYKLSFIKIKSLCIEERGKPNISKVKPFPSFFPHRIISIT